MPKSIFTFLKLKETEKGYDGQVIGQTSASTNQEADHKINKHFVKNKNLVQKDKMASGATIYVTEDKLGADEIYLAVRKEKLPEVFEGLDNPMFQNCRTD